MSDDKKPTNPMKSPTVQKGEPVLLKKEMNFGDAMTQVVLRNKKVTRKTWDEGWFISLHKKEDLVSLTDPDGQVRSFTLRGIDVLCEDYIIV